MAFEYLCSQKILKTNRHSSGHIECQIEVTDYAISNLLCKFRNVISRRLRQNCPNGAQIPNHSEFTEKEKKKSSSFLMGQFCVLIGSYSHSVLLEYIVN